MRKSLLQCDFLFIAAYVQVHQWPGQVSKGLQEKSLLPWNQAQNQRARHDDAKTQNKKSKNFCYRPVAFRMKVQCPGQKQSLYYPETGDKQ